MRIAVVDPYGRSIKFLDERGSPEVFSQRHVGRGKKVEWSMVAPGLEEGDPGLGVAMDQDGLRKLNQRFFRLSRVPMTFPGTCVFFGLVGEMITHAPTSFLENLASKVIFCPEETVVLRIERKSVPLDDPKLGRIPVMRQIPVFGQKKKW
jgi:hypothetical protein